MKKIILILIIIFSVAVPALAEEVSITASIAQETPTAMLYSIDITEINIDLIGFDIDYTENTLQLTGISAGSQIDAAYLTSNLANGKVLIDLEGTDGETISGNILLVSFNVIGSGLKDIGVSNVDIATGIGSGVIIDNINEDELESDDDELESEEDELESEEERKFTNTTVTPDDNTNQNQQQNQQTPSNNNQQTPSNNNDNNEEPEDDNSILIYSLIAVGALILIVGGFVAWNKFKKPKDELPIHETTPLQQPDQPQPTQPAPQQPDQSQQPQPAPDQPPTDQQPDQPTQ